MTSPSCAPSWTRSPSAYASWQASLTPATLSDAQALPLRMELVAIGERLDIAVRQARLLSEAALVPVPGAFDSTGLAAKPKRRAGRGLPFGLEDPSADSAPDSAGEELDLDSSEAPAEPGADAVPPAAPPDSGAGRSGSYSRGSFLLRVQARRAEARPPWPQEGRA